jgi:hypothetical protein
VLSEVTVERHASVVEANNFTAQCWEAYGTMAITIQGPNGWMQKYVRCSELRSLQSHHACFAPGYGMKTWLNKLLPFFNSPASLLCFIVSVTCKKKILILSKLIMEWDWVRTLITLKRGEKRANEVTLNAPP